MTVEENVVATDRRPRGRPPVGRLVTAAVWTLLLVVGVLPDLLHGLDKHTPFAQLQAFRQWTLLATAVVLLILAVATVAWRWVWPFTAGTLVVVLVGMVLVVPRAVADAEPTGGRPLTILSYNTYEGNADVNALAEAIRANQPDLVSLPEAGDEFRSELAPLIEPMGYTVKSSTGSHSPDVDGVTTAVAKRLGAVAITIGHDTEAFPYLVVTGGTLGSLRFVAFHAVAPTIGSTHSWWHDIGLLPRWCAGSTPAVVAGDFNSTLDHSLFRDAIAGCGDAADQRGDGLIPTWGPNDLIRHTIGPQIDHILATHGIEAQSFDVIDIPGSDHRAILAELAVPA